MRRTKGLPVAAAGLAALAFLAFPPLAAAWADAVSLPALQGLNRLAGALPFPVAEPLALLLAAGMLRAVLGGRPVRALRSALLLAAGSCLLWLPLGCAEDFAAQPAPGVEALEALCGRLIDALNASPDIRPDPDAILAEAPLVAGLPGATVKASRAPGWMRAAHLAGVFVPWTGEPLVDAGAHPALLPFTAVHELMHLSGISGEGAANIEAFRRCETAGGPFATSARLWALRYAAGLLAAQNPAAQDRLAPRMSAATLSLWQGSGGAIPPGNVAGYHSLACRLAADAAISDAPPG